MKKLTSAFLLIILFSTSSSADTFRVNNRTDIPIDYTPAHVYSDLALAINDASSGDTILIEGSPISYGTGILSINKELIILGPGGFLSENPMTQAYQEHAFLRGLNFDTGSENSVLSGMKLEVLQTNVDDITITRNWITHNQTSISIDQFSAAGSDRILIEQNFLHVTSGNSACIVIGGTSTPHENLIVRNNVMITNGRCITTVNHSLVHEFFIESNIFKGDMSISHANFTHNIWINGNFAGGDSHNICSYNMSSATQFSDIDGMNSNQSSDNCENEDMEDVFIDPTSSIDKGYALLPNSPAADPNEPCVNINELGIFGGSAPYILSNLPRIPAIYEATIPAAGTNTLNINIKAKAH